MRMIHWLKGIWHARTRKLDIQILWPACVAAADGDLDRAKAAFATHAYNDPGWLFLGQEGVYKAIDKLEAPK